MGTYWIFFTRDKHSVSDICTFRSFENIQAGLQLFMVAIRTVLESKNLRADAGKDQRGVMGNLIPDTPAP